jgi:phage terminase large subunit
MSFRRYRDYKQGEFYVVGVDTSWGGTDYCSAQFLSKTHLDVPTVYHSKVLATEMTPLIHNELERIYDETKVKPVVAFERNNGGVAEIERLATLNRNGKYRIYTEKTNIGTTDSMAETVKLGWTTSSASRPTMLSMLKEAIDSKLIRVYDKPTITEMFSFIISQTSSSWKAQAEQGAHDDLIMALAIAWQLYQTENAPKQHERKHREVKRLKLHV